VVKHYLYIFIGLVVAITACDRPTPPEASEEDGMFDLTSYFQIQKQKLKAEQPMVLKSVTTEQQPTETVQTDKVDWDEELTVFEQVDLNRPALQEYYTQKKTSLPGGNTLIEYRKIEDSEPLVQYLRLVLSPNKKLQQLNAVLQDRNPLFFSKREVELQANPETGNIAGYSIKGVQKLIFNDSLHYRINANL
jgi:hypothetical protein